MNADTRLLSCRKAAKRTQEKWSIIRYSREWAAGGAANDTNGDKNKMFGERKVKKQEMVLAAEADRDDRVDRNSIMLLEMETPRRPIPLWCGIS